MLLQRKNNEEEQEANTDRYLLTYADLITLLLGLFIILYASSQVDEEKYKEYSAAFMKYFNNKETVSAVKGGTGVLQGSRQGLPEPILPPSSTKSLDEFAQETEKLLNPFISKGIIDFQYSSKGVVLILPEKLMFKSGKADIQPEGENFLDTLVTALYGIPFQVSIDGHTDSDKISNFRYSSNWHLAAARAVNVAYSLISRQLPEHNLTIRAFGSQRPIADNTSAEGKAKNRRVEITISELPSEAPSAKGYKSDSTAAYKTKVK
ncbi:MAG: chemotaxis protein MotB [Bacteroidota bacterium]|nr:chemotaxis protein MotB [Bacteroidota bacterium]